MPAITPDRRRLHLPKDAISPQEARAWQEEARNLVRLRPLEGPIAIVAGIDVAYHKPWKRAFCVAVALDATTLEMIEQVEASVEVTFPYVPGLLSFREIPVIAEAWEKLQADPDLVLCDGQGYAHPRRMGLACHVGLLTGKPTIGCAKKILVGEAEMPGEGRSSTTPLIHKDEVVGSLVRTRDKVKPMVISPGHLTDIETATEWALKCGRGYRLPEPTRLADREVASYKKRFLSDAQASNP